MLISFFLWLSKTWYSGVLTFVRSISRDLEVLSWNLLFSRKLLLSVTDRGDFLYHLPVLLFYSSHTWKFLYNKWMLDQVAYRSNEMLTWYRRIEIQHCFWLMRGLLSSGKNVHANIYLTCKTIIARGVSSRSRHYLTSSLALVHRRWMIFLSSCLSYFAGWSGLGMSFYWSYH